MRGWGQAGALMFLPREGKGGAGDEEMARMELACAAEQGLLSAVTEWEGMGWWLMPKKP